ncbi:MAG TPA: hypothetical protein H9909_05550, partial [Candidatus Mediterraneibacter norfolkensis]|nr:hypothetical protein [Candidatus Mediterraneibacter norfolkensis]
MKRKVILALLATMMLTVGSFGTAFAMNSTPTIELQTNEIFKQADTPEEPEVHTHTWGDAYYVKDADAVYDQVKVVDQPEKWDWVTNIVSPAWDEDIKKIHTVCYNCGCDFDAEGMSNEEVLQHAKDHMLAGESGQYGSREVVVDTVHHEAVTEDVWTKIQDEISHTENKLVSPEKGHWEHKCTICGEIQDRDTGKVIEQGTITTPESPDTDKPGDTTENTSGNTQTSGDNTGNTDENTQKPGTSTGDNS